MGHDRRLLIEIIAEDDAAVKRLGVSHAAIAERMQFFEDAGRKGLGDGIQVAPHFEVEADSVRGKLPCPFGDHGFFQKNNVRVINKALGEEVLFTGLNIHMIKTHGFYEGRGATYRQDPARLVRVLEVPPVDIPPAIPGG